MKNKHKKPAMALILIIIIITSVTVVIMGTLKILTASAGNYSVNRNAKGVINIKKPLGRYICFKVYNKGENKYDLYESRVDYDSDGEPISEVKPELAENGCLFKIPEGIGGLNVTLIGGGAGGGISYFSGIDYRRNNSDGEKLIDYISKKDELGNNITNNFDFDKYPIEISWNGCCNDNKSDCKVTSSEVLSNETYKRAVDMNNTNATSLEQYFMEKFNADKKICTDSIDYRSYLNSCPSNFFKESPPGAACNAVYNVTININGTEIKGHTLESYVEAFNFTKLIRNLQVYEPYAFSIDNLKSCTYTPYYVYVSSSTPSAGNVERFSILKSDLDKVDNFKICKAKPVDNSVCNGIIGDGSRFNEAGSETTFTYTSYLKDDKTEKKNYTTNMADAVSSTNLPIKESDSGSATADNMKSQSGQEAEITIPDEFNFSLIAVDEEQLKLHSGYVDSDNRPYPATLFGSSGAVYVDNNIENCKNAKNSSYEYSIRQSSLNCPLSNNVTPCSTNITNPTTIKNNLRGAPGAIMIEW